MILKRSLLVVALSCAIVVPARSAEEPSKAPCSTPEHRALDFWVGEWEVSDKAGKPAGRSSVQRILDGCAIFENWTSIGNPYAGQSFNTFDPKEGRWTQYYVDSTGLVAQMTGAFAGKNLVYRREFKRADGRQVASRMTFFNLDGNQVRQLVEQSTDGGETWNTQYDLTYRRRAL